MENVTKLTNNPIYMNNGYNSTSGETAELNVSNNLIQRSLNMNTSLKYPTKNPPLSGLRFSKPPKILKESFCKSLINRDLPHSVQVV